MLSIVGPWSTGLATGGAGSGAANADLGKIVRGRIIAIHLAYGDSPPAGTTDVTLKTTGDLGGSETILTVANAATDGWFYPRRLVQGTNGADLTGTQGGDREPFAICDDLNLAIAQANNDDYVKATLLVESD